MGEQVIAATACDDCGRERLAEDLIEVYECDANAGYHNLMHLCSRCNQERPKSSRACGRHQ